MPRCVHPWLNNGFLGLRGRGAMRRGPNARCAPLWVNQRLDLAAGGLIPYPVRQKGPHMPTAPPCALVIFGASGDLAKLELIPAIYELAREKLLPANFALVGFSRTEMSDGDFRGRCREAIAKNARSKKSGLDESLWKDLEGRTYYVAGDYGDGPSFARLK